MKTNVEVTGKQRELMALLGKDGLNTCGLDSLTDIAIQEHFEPALKDAGQGQWTSEAIDPRHRRLF